MDSRIGLDYIVRNPDYTKKLAAALDTKNLPIKKQVFELLSDLNVYNEEGYKRALETLEHYQAIQNERYRFKVVVEQLQNSEDVDYLSCLVAFVNTTIVSAKSVKERVSIRNEFIGLKVLDTFAKLRTLFLENTDNELFVQLDLFDEQRLTDECRISETNGVDLNSHQDVFFTILRQVAETPQEIPFLSILQHLLRIDSSLSVSDIIWDAAEKLVHRATLCETKEDTEKLLRAPSYHHNLNKLVKTLQETGGRCQCSCHVNGDVSCGRMRKRTPLQLSLGEGTRTPGILSPTNSATAFSPELLATLSRAISPPPRTVNASLPLGAPASQTAPELQSGTSAGPPPPPPPPPPPLSFGLAPPPPPPPPPLRSSPPPPPPPPGTTISSEPAVPAVETKSIQLPQQATPKPKNKMKSLNWTKIPSNKVIGRKNLWSMIAKAHDGSPNNLDFETIEDLFCQQNTLNGQQSPRLGHRGDKNGKDSFDRKKRESSEINLLDGKRSLNVNIFLKQFRSSNDDIVNILKRGTHEEIGSEKLRGLLKVLPESDEIELLRGYNGDRYRLGNAEKFLLQLIELPNYKLRCEAMLLKEEFASNMAYLEPSIESIESAVEELKHCEQLHEILYMLLVAGNFLNSGGYAGDAAGFKMMSLLKIAEIRANKPGMNLIHYVAQEAENKYSNLLKFPEMLPNLEGASKLSIETLKTEITNLSNKVAKINQQISSAGQDIKQQMDEFLSFAQSEVMLVQKQIHSLEKVREDMAEFLCEDLQSFKLEECFKVFQSFCQKFKSSIEENERRRQQEKRAEIRRKQREEKALKKKISEENQPPSFSGSESDNIIDMLLGDIHGGLNRFVDGGSMKSARGSGRTKRCSPEGQGTPIELSRMNSLTSSVPSEDDPTASPRVVRRRIGSSNSIINGSGGDFDSFDAQSPDVTPTGTMRRRRQRLSSEDKEDSLIDFLRQTADAEHSKTEKSKNPNNGSLDRSLIRRSARRRRPEIAELNDRERLSSPVPSPLLERRTVSLEPETSKPKQWRTKIEEWLQENEKEQEREKKLREKIARERQKRQESESRESDFSSSIEKSDEGRPPKNYETLHEAKTDSEIYANKSKNTTLSNKLNDSLEGGLPPKDKSKWRKSNLNVANSSESIDDERRRNRSRKQKSDVEDDTICFYMKAPESSEQSASVDRENETSSNQICNKQSPEGCSGVLSTHQIGPIACAIVTDQLRDEQPETKAHEGAKQTLSKREATENINPSKDPEIAIGRSRFYHSMRDSSLNKAEQEVRKDFALDDQCLFKPSVGKETQKELVYGTVGTNIDEIPKTTVSDEKDEGNFDRFSFMRKTTKRIKPKQKVQVNETNKPEISEKLSKNVEDSINTIVDLHQHDIKQASDVKKTQNVTSKDINPETKETLNICEDKGRSRGIFTKNVPDSVRSETSDDTKRKDKNSTSLKTRLSRKLLSLTENLKGGTKSDHPDTSFSQSIRNPPEDKKIPSKEFPCERNEKALTERKASFGDEKRNPIIQQMNKHSPDPEQICYQSQNQFKPILVEPKLLKESLIADTNNIKVVHATPINHNFKTSEPYPVEIKGKDESEKDEGFEETQSQLSEVASQEAGSNYDTDLVESPKSMRQTKGTTSEKSDLNAGVSAMTLPNLSLSDKDYSKINEREAQIPNAEEKCIEQNSSLNLTPPNSLPLQTRESIHTPTETKKSNSIRSLHTTGDANATKRNNQKDKSSTEKNYPVLNDKFNGGIRRSSKGNMSNLGKNQSLLLKGSRLPIKDSTPQKTRTVAGYTKAINSLTKNLRGTKPLASYDVTQSMPPTPSEEQKSLLSCLKSGENKKKTSSSLMKNPRSQRRRSSERSLNGILGMSSRRGSEKSLSRPPSDRSLNLSRKSSEASVVTVKSAKRAGSPRHSKLSPTTQSNVSQHITSVTNPRINSRVLMTKPVALRSKSPQVCVPLTNSKTVTRSNSTAKQPVSKSRPNATLRRTSSTSDKSCGFMKATSASSAKSSLPKSIQESDPHKIQTRTPLVKIDISNRMK